MSVLASRYHVIRSLAEGGMGEILLARRLGPAGFEKLVVLKRPLQRGAGSPGLVTALVEEARLLARINHPNVCQVHDLEEADGQFFLAMEFLEGLSLWEVLVDAETTHTPIDPQLACGMFEQVCEGLEAIHGLRARDGRSSGVVHRDISPGNLFVTESGIVKILDLGIAKSTDSEEHTPFGRVKGKLAYVSPEQARGQPFDGRADLFALGLVLYDLIRARRPAPDRIGALAADGLDYAALPSPIVEVVRKAIEIIPGDRFGSAGEMAAALRAAGAALGGVRTRSELAAWLALRFAPELAKRRAGIREAITGAGTDTGTQILSLRSVLPVEIEDPTSLVSRETERLALPEHERLSGADVIPGRVARGRLPGLIVGAALAVGAAAIVLASARMRQDARPPVAPPAPLVAPAAPLVAPAAPLVAAAPPVAPAPQPVVPAPQPVAPPHQVEPTAAKPIHPMRTINHRRPVATPAPGKLTVDSMPYAAVWLGGRALNKTPIWQLSVAPGRYELHAVTGDGREQTVAVTIEPGRERKLRLAWDGR